MTARHYLAFDLGAESGRAIAAEYSNGVLSLNELSRFPNGPVRIGGALHWDILRLWLDILAALHTAATRRYESVGLDTWGCDFALLGERATLLENPYCYRDSRTDGVSAEVFERVPWPDIYAATGIQFLPFNSLFQLYAACRNTPRTIDAATALLTIPDLLNFWLSGKLVSEYTIATTTGCVDARTRWWATDLLARIGLPARLLPPIVEPGTVLGEIAGDVSAAAAGTPLVAPACHDTGSAFAGVAGGSDRAFLSSGTWSLLGCELAAPVISERARELNFTNEGGVYGTTRVLKNIAGLWLLQVCRREWAAAGRELAYEDLLAAARGEPDGFRSLFDPDDEIFLHPSSMLEAIAEVCRRTDQEVPKSPSACTRAILESLAFKYRMTIDALEEMTGSRITEVRIVGGGSRNRLLNQFTADATGRRVVAGPVEATALGNVAVQMVATGAVRSIAEAREVIAGSFPVERFDPQTADVWNREYARYRQYVADA